MEPQCTQRDNDYNFTSSYQPLLQKKHGYDQSTFTAMSLETAITLQWQANEFRKRQLCEQFTHQQSYAFINNNKCINNNNKNNSNNFDKMYTEQQDHSIDSPTSVVLRPVKRLRTIPKQVQFSAMATMTTIEAPTEDEYRNRWYGPDDYRFFSSENRSDVETFYQNIHNLQSLNTDTITVVGLEQFLQGRAKLATRRLQGKQHKAMVLEMYDVQRCNGVLDPELVRRISLRYSDIGPAQMRANLLAQKLHGDNHVTSYYY